jgi:hypothetical protein
MYARPVKAPTRCIITDVFDDISCSFPASMLSFTFVASPRLLITSDSSAFSEPRLLLTVLLR